MPEVFNGTSLPTFIPLSAGQILAVGDFDGCTGTLIAPRWVLTASHCNLDTTRVVEFCIGPDPSAPTTCLQARRVVDHPVKDVDLTLVELTEDATDKLASLEPIPILLDVMDSSWIGRMAEAAGYGLTENEVLGTRFFTAEPIVTLSNLQVSLDGQGLRGLCFGDSGGPVFVVAPDNSVRVAGALSTGDSSCTGKDNFSRTDLQQEWIESFTGPTMPGTSGCGRVDAVGRCDGGMAMWCEGGALQTEGCGNGTRCGWDDSQSAFRCISGADPCNGFDRRGDCVEDVARWCEDGVPRARDCGACGATCSPFATTEGAYCLDETCTDTTTTGQCNSAPLP